MAWHGGAGQGGAGRCSQLDLLAGTRARGNEARSSRVQKSVKERPSTARSVPMEVVTADKNVSLSI